MLTDADRRALWAAFMSQASAAREALALSKIDLRAAVDAIDQWVGDNAASFSAAIPQPARSALTMKQKLRLFKAILNRRWEVE